MDSTGTRQDGANTAGFTLSALLCLDYHLCPVLHTLSTPRRVKTCSQLTQSVRSFPVTTTCIRSLHLLHYAIPAVSSHSSVLRPPLPPVQGSLETIRAHLGIHLLPPNLSLGVAHLSGFTFDSKS